MSEIIKSDQSAKASQNPSVTLNTERYLILDLTPEDIAVIARLMVIGRIQQIIDEGRMAIPPHSVRARWLKANIASLHENPPTSFTLEWK